MPNLSGFTLILTILALPVLFKIDTSMYYSNLGASTGSSFAALLAGYRPKNIPTTLENRKATIIFSFHLGTSCIVSFVILKLTGGKLIFDYIKINKY